jgi:hypothetical protein
MDVHCSSCGEPWDVYHLRHEVIFDTEIDPAEAENWHRLSPAERLSSRFREKFKAAGYEFGASILDVSHCPSCPKGAKPDPDDAALKAGLVELLGDDEDAIASMMEELGL